jgi:hypothetical protein
MLTACTAQTSTSTTHLPADATVIGADVIAEIPPTVATDLGPALIGLAGVIVGGVITTAVPVYLGRRALDVAFRRAALVVLLRRANVLTAAEGFAEDKVRWVLDLLQIEVEAQPDRARLERLRNEVYLLGDELNALVEAFANYKSRRRAAPTSTDFLTVRNAFSDLLIRHDIGAMSDPDIASTLTAWANNP